MCNTCYHCVDWFCSRRAPPPPPWDSPPARISSHNRATYQERFNNKRRTHQEDINAATQQHITNSLAARSPTNSTNRHQELIGSVNLHLIIIKHAYASTNYCFTHLRALLVLQEPRHLFEPYWCSWPSLTSVVEGRGCPPSEVTCGGQNEHGRR